MSAAIEAMDNEQPEIVDVGDDSIRLHEAGYAGHYDEYIEIMCYRPSQNASYVYRARWEVSYMQEWAAEWLQVGGDFRTWWEDMSWSDMVKNMEEFIRQHGVDELIDRDYSEWLAKTVIS
ncbi:hypothetical protein DCC81_12130 [Chitinophaga parva]|uniref:Uncharacterized protein n=2 Tax=Chitinophaga parva TaxID=2169414 RepID=A0A2T7BFK5_9BACT|nr:hypothetical protein DCC81_12130 [Chitinophaga parva]